MKREDISKAINGIDTRYIQEAVDYTTKKTGSKKLAGRHFTIVAIAAVILLCIIAGGTSIVLQSGNMAVNAYAYGTDDKIETSGVVLNTGTISDNGEMKGIPLIFYLSGSDIESVRFSCKNQKIRFIDWTEKRDEFGTAQNFTVPYGSDESEYYYLTVGWEPDDTIQELTDNSNSKISTLPDKLREDIIVLEITFANGKKLTKAVYISLLDDGTFFAKFDNYKISDDDSCEKRADDITLRELSKIEEAQIKEKQKESKNKPKSKAVKAAAKVAKEYYSGSVFKVISMEMSSRTKNEIIFSVCVSKDGIIQDPDRSITLKLKNGTWKVTGEGY